ncbi:MAG: hypothetical protein AABW80_00210 [Nanoarchaeota archaeon]
MGRRRDVRCDLVLQRKKPIYTSFQPEDYATTIGYNHVVAKRNIGVFFTGLSAIYLDGGKVRRITKADTVRLIDGQALTFRPDLTQKDSKGLHFTEVKAVSKAHGGQVFLYTKQLAHYIGAMMQRMNKGDRLPSVNYVLWRYANRNDNISPYSMGPRELLEYLSSTVKGGLVIPLNLTLAVYALANHLSLNHSGSKHSESEASYKQPRISLLRVLGEQDEMVNLREGGVMEKVFDDYVCSLQREFNRKNTVGPRRSWRKKTRRKPLIVLKDGWIDGEKRRVEEVREFASEHLALDSLVVDRNDSRSLKGRMFYRGKALKLADFPITTYSFESRGAERKWLDHFSANRGEILRFLRIPDFKGQEERMEREGKLPF